MELIEINIEVTAIFAKYMNLYVIVYSSWMLHSLRKTILLVDKWRLSKYNRINEIFRAV